MIDQPIISRMLSDRRHFKGLSIRDVAKETGISPSTISRFERSECQLKTDLFITMCRWLGIKSLEYDKVVTCYPTSTIDAICEVIQNDKKLRPKSAEALCNIMRESYQVFAFGRTTNAGTVPKIRGETHARILP